MTDAGQLTDDAAALQASDLPAWAMTFEPFGTQHIVTVAVWSVVIVVWVLLGLAWRGTPREAALRWLIGGAAFQSQLLMTIYWMQPARWTLEESLPLHMCDLLAFGVPLALAFPKSRWSGAVMLLWGVGLTTQSFITPTVIEGPASPVFWFYWLQHVFLAGSGAYLVVVHGYRPRFGDVWRLGLIGIGLTAASVVLNEAIGTNYWYSGSVGVDKETILDYLPPWPWRVVVMSAVGIGFMAIIWALFVIGGVLRRAVVRPTDPKA
ncbi:MAG: TIGR02206 family membrane protein [Planctomycetota bacterium]